jgi:hypothetical protein
MLKNFLFKFSSSFIMLIGNLFYNFIILYFSSTLMNVNFLYFITVLITITSLLYGIENIFQYHFGRLLYKQNTTKLNKTPSYENFEIDEIGATINIFYKCFLTIVLCVFLPLILIFSKYYDIVIIFLFITIFYIASGYFSIKIISKNDLKKLHFSTGILKIFLFIISLYFFKILNHNIKFLFLLLLLFSLFHLILQIYTSKYISSEPIKNELKNRKTSLQLFSKIAKSPLQQTVISLVGFLILKFYILIGNKYLSKDIINSSSLIQSLFGISLMFGGMYTVLNMNVFSSGNNKEKATIYKKSLYFSILIYFISLALIVIFNNYFLTRFNYKVLPNNILIVISIIYFFETILGISATLYLYMQNIVYYKSSILTATALLITYSLIYFNFTSINPTILMSIPLFFQLIYNYWYYPSKLYLDLNK